MKIYLIVIALFLAGIAIGGRITSPDKLTAGQCVKAIEIFCYENGIPKNICETGFSIGSVIDLYEG